MQKGDRVELFVEKLVFEGAGLARYNDLPVFIDGVAPQEHVLAEINSVNKNFARAKLINILKPSQHRVKPFCAMANICGGCNWQHVDYAEQLRQKKQIVQETIKKISGLNLEVKDVIPSPQIKEYRHKIQYPVGQTKVSKRILAGYYKKNTHELINIKHCPIQPPIIDKITTFIREKAQEFNLIAYNERKHSGLLRHIVCRHSQTFDEVLVVFVVNDCKITKELKTLAQLVFDSFDNVVGCLVNFNQKKTNSIMGQETQCVVGKEFYLEKIGDKNYQVSANSFFQVNPQSAKNILDIVRKLIKENTENPTILDAYSGVGSFGIYLGDIAKNVTCVEEAPSATKDAIENIKINNYDNFDILTGDASAHLENFVKENRTFDVVIVDPPRKGLAPKAVQTSANLSNNFIIYISCNPTTLARDMKLFKTYGFEADYVQPVDMFCHTYHIENVVMLKNINNNLKETFAD